MADDLIIIGRDGSVFAYPGNIGTGPYVLENEDVPEFDIEPTISAELVKYPLISLIFGMFPGLYKSKSIKPPKSVIRHQATARSQGMPSLERNQISA
jgi:hypothetical protein